jgi:hypothetical protein
VNDGKRGFRCLEFGAQHRCVTDEDDVNASGSGVDPTAHDLARGTISAHGVECNP